MILAGDIVPLRANVNIPFMGDEFVLANLEAPVMNHALTPIKKAGPSLWSLPFALKGRWAFALANNHMMDYGCEGLKQTLSFLDGFGCAYAGAGESVQEARQPMTFREGGKQIFSCCEKQFGIAGHRQCGVAEKGLWLVDAIAKARRNGAQCIIVSCHAAAELSPFPSPDMQDFYRFLVDAGADVVHGHHSHVPQGYEEYHGRLITYGLGNFVVDQNAGWQSNPNYLWSLLIHINFDGPRLVWHVEKHGIVPTGADDYMNIVNKVIGNRRLLEGVWQEIATRLLELDYAPMMRLPPTCGFCQGKGLGSMTRDVVTCFRRIAKKIMGRTAGNLDEVRLFWHYFACESHREAIETSLGVMSGAIEDLRTPETKRLVERIGGIQDPLI